MKKKITLLLLAALVIIQFIQIDKTQELADDSRSITQLEALPSTVATSLENACFNCHSNHTDYPWYSYVQPVGWWLQDHVEEARHHLNFSEWGNMSLEDKKHAAEEVEEEVEEGEMPLKPYTWMHCEARLDEVQTHALVEWFEDY